MRQVAAGKVLSEACGVVGNRDIEPFIPVLVSSIARPAEVPDCVHKLSATTFVQVRPAQAWIYGTCAAGFSQVSAHARISPLAASSPLGVVARPLLPRSCALCVKTPTTSVVTHT